MTAIISLDWATAGAAVGDHLWQSTVCAVVAWLATLALRKNNAAVRHGIWLAASLKFLVPFSMLSALGGYLGFGLSRAPAMRPAESSLIVRWSRPLAAPVSSVLSPRLSAEPSPADVAGTPYILPALWCVGFAGVLLYRYGRGRRLRTLVREAKPLLRGREAETLQRAQSRSRTRASVRLVCSSSTIEPGIHGIFDPVLVLPAGIADRLTDPQLQVVLTHELIHVRRRDNLTAAFQMAVETIYWFHPLVWWIGTRIVDERERACDEEVLQSQADPQVYAGAILAVCEFYLASPSACISGIAGSNLKKRIETILLNNRPSKVNLSVRALLATAVTAALSLPILFGSIQSPAAPATSSRQTFDVASIRLHADQSAPEGPAPPPPAEGGIGGPDEFADPDQGPPVIRVLPGGRLLAVRATLRSIIRDAYPSRPGWRLEPWRIEGGPEWIRSAKYDIEAKSPNAKPEQMLPMLQSLLADRFGLRFHWETRELPIYELTGARGGLKLEDWKEGSCVSYESREDTADPFTLPPPPPPPPPGGGGTSRPAGIRPNQPCGLYISISGPVARDLYALKATMSEFVPLLEYMLKRTIVDKTGFKGIFNLHLAYEDNGPRIPEPAAPGTVDSPLPVPRAGLPFASALQEQGGLKLESRRGPVSVLVIDNVERPGEN